MNDITALLPHIKLRLNIEHPSFEECYIFGYECAASEITEDENPFAAGTREHNQWLEGWWAGFYNEEPLFSLEGNLNNAQSEFQEVAANDQYYPQGHSTLLGIFIKLTGAIVATAVVGYQVFELVA